jgi:hypothetical protein
MVRFEPPVELKVSDCVVGVLRFTLPKAMLVVLMLSVADAAVFSCRVKVLLMVPAVAVRVADCAVDTAVATVAEKLAVVLPGLMVTAEGVDRAILLLERLTVNPPLAAALFRVTVHVSVPVPVIEEFVQDREVSAGTPVPLKATTVEAPVEELLASVSWPVAAPAVVGSNCTVKFADCFELIISGNVAPETVKPAPKTVAALTVTAAVPVEVSVTVCVVGEFTAMLPKLRLDGLIARVEVDAGSCRAKVLLVVPAVAVRVADCAADTAEIVAGKLAAVLPAAMVTDEGTATAVLLLARLTANPPLAAAALTVTVHASVPALVIDEFVQERAVSAGTPVPFKATMVEAPVEELLASISWPVAAPAVVGSNCTVKFAD